MKIESQIVKLGKIEVDLEELRDFIIEAKKNGYAGNMEEQIAEDGSKMLTFQKGNFHYTDNYDGHYQFNGTEILRFKRPNGQRIWQMSYNGMIWEAYKSLLNGKEYEAFSNEVFTFLKKALSHVERDQPFRGPKEFSEGDFKYKTWATPSDISRFNGDETININERTCYNLRYAGGLIIPK